jgi:hypothetical protein
MRRMVWYLAAEWCPGDGLARTVRFALPACIAVLLAATLVTVPPAKADHTEPPNAVSVPGSHNGEMGCPGDWQPECPKAQLTRDPSDGVWKGAFTLPAGSYEYKVALNNAWMENFGAGAVPGGSNIAYTTAGGPVRFFYDQGTHWATSDAEGPIVTAPGTFQSELGCPADWSPECMRSWLQDLDNDGVYTFVTTAIPAGTYEAKVTHGLSWAESYGAGGVGGGANIPFYVAANGNRTTFSYVLATHELTVSVGAVPAATPVAPTVNLTDPVNAAIVRTSTVSGTGEAGTTANISIDDTNPATPAVNASVFVGPEGYSVTLDLSGLNDGTLTATVTLTDGAGNVSPSTTDTAIKDTVAPVLTVDLPPVVNNATKSSVTVTGTGEGAASVAVSVDDGDPATAAVRGFTVVSNGSYSLSLDLSGLADGTLTATALANDSAGNPGAATDTAIKDTVAPFAPTVNLTDPVNPANVATATVSGTAEANTTVNISVDDTNPTTPAVTATVRVGPAGYDARLDLTSLDDGRLTATVTVVDGAGNIGPGGTDSARRVGSGGGPRCGAPCGPRSGGGPVGS